jgi:hypothetical protein
MSYKLFELYIYNTDQIENTITFPLSMTCLQWVWCFHGPVIHSDQEMQYNGVIMEPIAENQMPGLAIQVWLYTQSRT